MKAHPPEATRADGERNEIVFRYRFRLEDGTERSFTVRLDGETLGMLRPAAGTPPDWARLEHHQCPHCPLSRETHPYCPIAANVVEPVLAFRDRISYEPCDVRVEGPHRAYETRTTLQKGLSSLLGIYMVTSGCPVMDKLRPMVEFHLPFASPDETTYRFVTMYLLAQYFLAKNGRAPDWTLQGLLRHLEEVMTVNVSVSGRLRSIVEKDANLNALTILANFGTNISLALELDDLAHLERIFLAHYEPVSGG